MAPDVTGLTVEDAKAAVKDAGLDCVLDGAGARVVGQLPAAGATLRQGALMMLYVEGSQPANAPVRVPDLAGMTVLEANKLLRSYGLELRVEGSGLAAGQDPAPETEVLPSTVVTARFEPPAADGA